jgi:hypothetical protein
MNISIVPTGIVYKTVDKLAAFLDTAAVYSRGRSFPDDLLRSILSGVYQLWVVHDDEPVIHGLFMTEVVQYPQKKLLCIQHCVIENNLMNEVEDQMQEIAERYAREAGCGGIEFVGRPGWKRHAMRYGYSAQSVKYQKFFGEVQDEQAA